MPVNEPLLQGDANISVDIDALPLYYQIHGIPWSGAEAVDPLWKIGIPRALELFAEFDLKATFFVVGQDLGIQAHRDVAQAMFAAGHELANHTFSHPYDLRRRSPMIIAEELRRCDQAIQDLTGASPVGFRAPGYNLSTELLKTSRALGHRYDASIFPAAGYWLAKSAVMAYRHLRRTPSGSDRTLIKTLLAPSAPYYCDPATFWRPSCAVDDYIELPIAAAASVFPLIGTSLHLLDLPGWRRIWPLLHRRFPRYFNLEFHAIDFVDAQDLTNLHSIDDSNLLVARQPDLRIPWPTKAKRYRRVLDSLCSDREMATLARLTEGRSEQAEL